MVNSRTGLTLELNKQTELKYQGYWVKDNLATTTTPKIICHYNIGCQINNFQAWAFMNIFL